MNYFIELSLLLIELESIFLISGEDITVNTLVYVEKPGLGS
jgi:hypothetical protein